MPENKPQPRNGFFSGAVDSIGVFVRNIRKMTNAGLLLIIVTLLALVWANSAYSEYYHRIWEVHLGFGFGSWSLDKSLHHWVNDGLMTVFFFVIGLEIKRELMIGRISTPGKAALPVFAALGGMVVPAFIFLFFNVPSGHPSGWGTAIATDIAFALGILTLLGNRVPLSVKTFLLALAIVDDLGAVVAIAIFYTADLNFIALGIAIAGFLMMMAMNRAGQRNMGVYLTMAVLLLWYPMLLSGVHATVAGVLAAIAIPLKRKTKDELFVNGINEKAKTFGQHRAEEATMLSGKQIEALGGLKKMCKDTESPLQRIENLLHPVAIFVIMPIFAFANTGILIDVSEATGIFGNPLGQGIIFGLVVGKFVGISLFSWLAIKLKWASLSDGFQWSHLFGTALLAGVGFTMSLFITELAFEDPHVQATAKLAIFTASLIAGVCGYLFMRLGAKKQ